MAAVRVEGIEGLRELIGQRIGPTDWVEVTQERIDKFAEVSGDHQWIHVDPERAARESPFRVTIAHGDMTLALVNGMRSQLIEHRGVAMALNYGWERVRYPAPVPVGSRLRVSAEVLSVDERGEGWWHVVTRLTVEREGSDKPVFVGDSAARILAAAADGAASD
jgi:acyl dehydratase